MKPILRLPDRQIQLHWGTASVGPEEARAPYIRCGMSLADAIALPLFASEITLIGTTAAPPFTITHVDRISTQEVKGMAVVTFHGRACRIEAEGEGDRLRRLMKIARQEAHA